MPILIVLILDAAIIYFFFGNWIVDALRTKASKNRHQLTLTKKYLQKRLLREGDLFTEAQTAAIAAQIAEIDAVDMKNAEAVKTCLEHLGSEKAQRQLPLVQEQLRDHRDSPCAGIRDPRPVCAAIQDSHWQHAANALGHSLRGKQR